VQHSMSKQDWGDTMFMRCLLVRNVFITCVFLRPATLPRGSCLLLRTLRLSFESRATKSLVICKMACCSAALRLPCSQPDWNRT
jgi:hypothetical protein